jgi:hypothetical protein
VVSLSNHKRDAGYPLCGCSSHRGPRLIFAIVWSLLQEMTPDALRGRVFGIFNTGAMAASMIGMVAFGWATDRDWGLGAHASLIGMTAIFGITAAALLLPASIWGSSAEP